MPEKDLVFDVGMHHGEDTRYYLAKGYKVVAFEADPNLTSDCRKAFRREIESGRLHIVDGALVDNVQPGDSIKFYRNIEKSDWGTVSADWAERNEDLGTSIEIIEVPAVNFSECVKRFGVPYYLKVDIEGMDLACLKSLRDFDDRPCFVSMESEKVSFAALISEIETLHDLGYNAFQAVQQNCMHLHPVSIISNDEQLEFRFEEGSSGPFGADLRGEWKTQTQIIEEYKRIFSLYRLLGDNGIITRIPGGKTARRAVSKLLHRAIPGWYDTHARHRDVSCQ